MASRLRRPSVSETDSAGDAWLTPGRFGLLLLGLVVLAFPEVIAGLRTFAFRDFGLFGHPLAFHHRQSFWDGRIPLWNPWNGCGLPFLAQWNTLTLYPVSLLYLLLPLPWSLNVFCLLHLWLAGVGLYLLGWRWTGHRFAAAFAGLVFAFNGLVLNSLMWPNNIAALGWMPWVILATERAWRTGLRRLLPAVILGGVQMLSGAPEIIVFTWLVAFVRCAVGHAGALPSRGRRLTRFIATAGCVAALAAAQWVPFLDLLARSHRQGEGSGSLWSLPTWGWVNFLSPLFRCFPVSGGVYLQSGQVWTSSYYVGVFTLALAVWGLSRGAGRRGWMLAGLGALGLSMAMGEAGYLYGAVHAALPQAGLMRYPVKFIVLTVFAAPLLAAWGLARATAATGTKPQASGFGAGWVLGAFVLILFGILAYVRVTPAGRDTAGWSVLGPNTGARIAFLALSSVALLAARRWRGVVPRLGLLGLVWLDLMTHVPRQNPTIQSAWLRPGWAREQSGPAALPELGEGRVALDPALESNFGRIVAPDPAQQYHLVRSAWDGSCNLLDRVPKLGGMFSLHLREMEPIHRLLRSGRADLEPLAAFVGWSHVGVLEQRWVWSPRPGAMPWVTLGPAPEFVDGTNALLSISASGFLPRNRVYLPREAEEAAGGAAAGRGRVLRAEFEAERIALEVEVEGPEPACLVLAQAFHHAWEAQVDRQPARIWRANYAFQALVVPSGRHTVVLRYVDRGFHAGLAVTLLATAAIGFRTFRELGTNRPAALKAKAPTPEVPDPSVKKVPAKPSRRPRHR